MRVISIPFMVLTLVAGSEILARETDGTDTTDGTQEENLNIGGKTWGGSLEDEVRITVRRPCEPVQRIKVTSTE